jgi:ubiquinone/menaquinone biosynthesis C-methylase UbiE
VNKFDPDAFSRFERSGWQRKARGYHTMYSPLSGHVVERLLDSVEAGSGKRLLDIGTGPGYVAAAARGRGCEVVGLDFAPAMVELARSLNSGCRFEIGDAQALPFPAATFDSVTGNFVLHHLPQQELALQEARRVLVSGGRIGLTAWGPPERNKFLGLFMDAVRGAGAAVPPDLPLGPPMAVSDAGYRDQLERAGFENMTVEHITWTHRFPSPAALWYGLMAASVRTAALIELQPARVRDVIHREFDTQVKAHQTTGGFEVPVAATLIGGRVPE